LGLEEPVGASLVLVLTGFKENFELDSCFQKVASKFAACDAST